MRFLCNFTYIALVLFPSNLDKTFHRVQRWAAWLRSQVLPPATAASFPLTEDFLVPGPRLFTITSGVISSDLINFPSIRNASKTTWTPHALHPWTLLDHLAPACSWSAKKKLHIWPQIAPARNSPHPENLPDEKSRSVGLMTVDHYFDSWWLNIPNLYSVSAPDLWRGPNCMLVTALLYKSTYFDFDDCQVPHWGAWPAHNLTVWSPQGRFPNSRAAWPLVSDQVTTTPKLSRQPAHWQRYLLAHATCTRSCLSAKPMCLIFTYFPTEHMLLKAIFKKFLIFSQQKWLKSIWTGEKPLVAWKQNIKTYFVKNRRYLHSLPWMYFCPGQVWRTAAIPHPPPFPRPHLVRWETKIEKCCNCHNWIWSHPELHSHWPIA